MGLTSVARTMAVAAFTCALLAPTGAHAQVQRLITGPYVSGWFGYWAADASVETLTAQGRGVVPEVNIFWAKFTGPTRPLCAYAPDSSCYDNPSAPWIDPDIDAQRQQMQSAGIKVLGTIVDASAARSLSDYLATDDSRTAYAAQITEWAMKAGFDGVDLDWEKFAFADGRDSWAVTKPRWVAFIQVLADTLHARGMLLSATVPAGSYPFLMDGQPNPGTGYWVYAWSDIIDSVDRLRIMAYDYSYTSPGPIGPYRWAQQVAESAIAQAATTNPTHKRKIWLGIPQYSRNWVRQYADGSYVTKGDCPSGWRPASGSSGIPGMLSQSLARAKEIAAREQVVPTWDDTSGEYTFRYWIANDGTAGGSPVTCTAQREVWFEDTRGARLKAGIVGDQGIAGLAVWEFGFVLDGFYAAMAREIAPPLSLRASFDSSVRLGTSTTVAGKVLRGTSPVSGARVSVTWVSRAGKTKSLASGLTNAKGRYALTVAPSRSGTLRITATSEGQRASVSKPITVIR